MNKTDRKCLSNVTWPNFKHGKMKKENGNSENSVRQKYIFPNLCKNQTAFFLKTIWKFLNLRESLVEPF